MTETLYVKCKRDYKPSHKIPNVGGKKKLFVIYYEWI